MELISTIIVSEPLYKVRISYLKKNGLQFLKLADRIRANNGHFEMCVTPFECYEKNSPFTSCVVLVEAKYLDMIVEWHKKYGDLP